MWEQRYVVSGILVSFHPSSHLEMAEPKPSFNSLEFYKLRNGYFLCYTTFGPADGRPVFFLHGFPGSRLEGAAWQEVAMQLNVRLIVPDRPGIGFSSFQKGRRIIDWPYTLLELAEHLSIERFHLLATSGGCPYALACLKTIPRERLLGTSVVSGSFPLSLGAEDMLLMSRVMLFIAAWFPWIMSLMLDILVRRPSRAKDQTGFERMFMKDVERWPVVDQECYVDENFKAWLLRNIAEAVTLQTYGSAWEARLLGSDWDFGLDEILSPRVTVWQGTFDRNCPVTMAERAVKKMAGAQLIILDEGHLSLPAKHKHAILENLLKTA